MLVPSLPSRKKFLANVVKNYTKADFKVSQFCPVLVSLVSSKYYVQDCRSLLFLGRTFSYVRQL